MNCVPELSLTTNKTESNGGSVPISAEAFPCASVVTEESMLQLPLMPQTAA